MLEEIKKIKDKIEESNQKKEDCTQRKNSLIEENEKLLEKRTDLTKEEEYYTSLSHVVEMREDIKLERKLLIILTAATAIFPAIFPFTAVIGGLTMLLQRDHKKLLKKRQENHERQYGEMDSSITFMECIRFVQYYADLKEMLKRDYEDNSHMIVELSTAAMSYSNYIDSLEKKLKEQFENLTQEEGLEIGEKVYQEILNEPIHLQSEDLKQVEDIEIKQKVKSR